jgi:hypothetical protein
MSSTVNGNSPFLRDVLPPDNAPRGRDPVGVKPFSCRTLSLSSLKENKQQSVHPKLQQYNESNTAITIKTQ